MNADVVDDDDDDDDESMMAAVLLLVVAPVVVTAAATMALTAAIIRGIILIVFLFKSEFISPLFGWRQGPEVADDDDDECVCVPKGMWSFGCSLASSLFF